jgi:hypothetical protein
MQRPRIKHTTSFEERLATEAQRLKDQAKKLPYGKERAELMRKVGQTEFASRINDWLNSPGLASPK